MSMRSQSDVERATKVGAPISELFMDPRRPKPTKDEIAMEVRARIQHCYDYTADLRSRIWPQRILMAFGIQDIVWMPRIGRWMTIPARRVKKYQNNVLTQRLALFKARMTQSGPSWRAIPPKDTLDSEKNAEFCDALLRYDYRAMKLGIHRDIWTRDCGLTGTGIAEVGYNKNGGKLVPVYQYMMDEHTGEVVTDMAGEPIPAVDAKGVPIITDVQPQGEFFIRTVSGYNLYVPEGVEGPDIQLAPYIIRKSWMTEGEVRETWDVPWSEPLDGGVLDHFDSMSSYFGWGTSGGVVQTKASAGKFPVMQYMEKPRDVKGFYKGKIYTVVGTKLIGEEDMLLEDGAYPFAIFPWIPRNDTFWSMDWIGPGCDPQIRINQLETYVMNHLGLVGQPNIIAPRNSLFPEKPVSGYNVYFVNPTANLPQFMNPPPASPDAYNMVKQSRLDLDDTTGQYPLGRGSNQAGITSGYHARVVQDADQTEMGPSARAHAIAWSFIGRSLLELHRRFDQEGRMLAIAGDDKTVEYRAFARSNIPVGMDVQVDEESLLVTLRSARIEEAKEFAGLGVFGNVMQDPAARESLSSYMRMPGLNVKTPEYASKKYIDDLHANILHEGWTIGQQFNVEPWWNMADHRRYAHERLVRESLRWTPDAKERFLAYFQAIEQAIAQQQQQAEAEQDRQAQKMLAIKQAEAEIEAQSKSKVEAMRSAGRIAEKSQEGASSRGAKTESPAEGSEDESSSEGSKDKEG